MVNLFSILFAILIVALFGVLGLIAWQLLFPPSGVFDLSKYTALVILCGVLIAMISWIWGVVRQESEDLLRESKNFFEKAFHTLNVTDDEGKPKNERMRWLTSSRLLTVARKLGNRVMLKSHKLIFLEIQEYWRQRFHDLVLPDKQGFPKEYFAQDVSHFRTHTSRDRIPLSLSSVISIYRFIQWHDDRTDPLDAEAPITLQEAQHMRKVGPVYLGELLIDYLDIVEKNES